MNSKGLLSVTEARARILAGVSKERPAETVALERAFGRTLATGLAAKRTQPPKPCRRWMATRCALKTFQSFPLS